MRSKMFRLYQIRLMPRPLTFYDYMCFVYRYWNDDLDKSLQIAKGHMTEKCETYFDEIKYDTVQVS
jgi:hypothetical protein